MGEPLEGDSMRYFSCDSHVVEAAEIYDGLTDKFGDRAPFIEKDHQGKPGTWLVLPNEMRAVPVGRLGIAGARLDAAATFRTRGAAPCRAAGSTGAARPPSSRR